VGTASYADPRATERLAKGLESWCKSHNVEKVSSLTGALKAGKTMWKGDRQGTANSQ